MSNSTRRFADEQLIPDRTEVPLRIVPPLLWVSVALVFVFVALGVYSESLHEPARRFALLSGSEASLRGYAIMMVARATFQLVMGWVPVLTGIVMLWVSFLSPRWSDRTLWSAAMIFTAYELSADATYLFSHKVAGEVVRTYPQESAVVGLIAYGSWLLIIPETSLPAWLKRALTALCALAVLAIVFYPAIDAYIRVVDTIGSVLFAGALFTLGIAVANRVGVSLLRRTLT